MAQGDPKRFKFIFEKFTEPEKLTTMEESLKKIKVLCEGITCEHIWNWLVTDIKETTNVSAVMYHIAILYKIVNSNLQVSLEKKINDNNFKDIRNRITGTFGKFGRIYNDYLSVIQSNGSNINAGLLEKYLEDLKEMRKLKATFINDLIENILKDPSFKQGSNQDSRQNAAFEEVKKLISSCNVYQPGPLLLKPGISSITPLVIQTQPKVAKSTDFLQPGSTGTTPLLIQKQPRVAKSTGQTPLIPGSTGPTPLIPGSIGTPLYITQPVKVEKKKFIMKEATIAGPPGEGEGPPEISVKDLILSIPPIECDPINCNTFLGLIKYQNKDKSNFVITYTHDETLKIFKEYKKDVNKPEDVKFIDNLLDNKIKPIYDKFNKNVNKEVTDVYKKHINTLNDELDVLFKNKSMVKQLPSRSPSATPKSGGFLNDFTIKQQDNYNYTSVSKPRFQFAFKY
jgi:hypothetical protein